MRWIDGQQNIADVLTKEKADKTTLQQYLRDGLICLTQTEANQRLKERKRAERQQRKVVQRESKSKGTEIEARVQAAVKDAEDILKNEAAEDDGAG